MARECPKGGGGGGTRACHKVKKTWEVNVFDLLNSCLLHSVEKKDIWPGNAHKEVEVVVRVLATKYDRYSVYDL